jgi:putative restriction endonuclease
MYLVKLTCPQELGWRDGHAGSRGPYLLVTKQWTEHLPPLSSTVFNDSAPLTLNFGGRAAVIPYVWHNAMYATEERRRRGVTREHNEYRIYIAGLAHNNIALPHPRDAVVLRPTADAGRRDCFDVWILREGTPAHAAILATRTTSGNYWIVGESVGQSIGLTHDPSTRSTPPAELIGSSPPDARPQAVQSELFVPAEYCAVPSIGNDVFERLSHAEDEALSSRTSDETFRFLVLNAYQMRCAFTNRVIRLGNGLMNLEAAHIKPKSHRGLNLTCNGIALCRDLHWAFDKGAFTLSDDMCAEVHPDVTDDFLRTIHGKRAFQPKAGYNLPRREVIEHHRQRVYGLFKLSGSLRRDTSDR